MGFRLKICAFAELQRCGNNYVNQQKEKDQDDGEKSNNVAKYNMVLLIQNLCRQHTDYADCEHEEQCITTDIRPNDDQLICFIYQTVRSHKTKKSNQRQRHVQAAKDDIDESIVIHIFYLLLHIISSDRSYSIIANVGTGVLDGPSHGVQSFEKYAVYRCSVK